MSRTEKIIVSSENMDTFKDSLMKFFSSRKKIVCKYPIDHYGEADYLISRNWPVIVKDNKARLNLHFNPSVSAIKVTYNGHEVTEYQDLLMYLFNTTEIAVTMAARFFKIINGGFKDNGYAAYITEVELRS